MKIIASARRRGPFGVQPRNRRALQVLPSRTGERVVYSLLPEDSRENGDIPEPPCETREKKSPFDDCLSHTMSAVGLPGGRRQLCTGEMREAILGSWWGLRQQKADGTIPLDGGHQRALVMEHDIEEGTAYA